MEILRLENLSKYYTSSSAVVMALTGIHASFSVGEFVAITGESGSGKSTLAKILGGMLPYEGGELYLNGAPTSHFSASDWERYRRDVIGFISQSYDIIPGNTVLENVEAVLRFSGVPTDEVRERALSYLREVELDTLARRRAAKLSSGQKQRLSIARALAKPSRILLADEPTGNLDRENSDKIIRLLKRASRDHLVILITHEYGEVENDATRHIVLSDGAIVTDAPVKSAPTEPSREVPQDAKAHAAKRAHGGSLSLYTARITAKSRPVFFSIIALLLCLTALITFVFLGTFLSSVDDSGTRIYSSEIFPNGDPHRLVVMRQDHKEMTEDDYRALLSVRYTVSLDRCGYSTDMRYYYVKDVDHRLTSERLVGQDYHPRDNPTDCHWVTVPKFIADAPAHYVSTLPTLARGTALTAGRAPEGIYEIVSADPNLRIGDTVTVYFRHPTEWGHSPYIGLTLTVVGESTVGEGLYFSDLLCQTLTSPVSAVGGQSYIMLPYDKDIFIIRNNHVIVENYKLPDNGFAYTGEMQPNGLGMGATLGFWGKDEGYNRLNLVVHYDTGHSKCILVSEEAFRTYARTEAQNQVSLYIKDYAYTERALDQLHDMGYIAFSPFKIGAIYTDPALSTERMITLAVCAATLVLCVLLQAILLKILFSSLNENLRLMSHIGLRAKTAYGAISLLMLMLTLCSIAVAFGIVVLLNGLGIERIVALYKYVEPIHVLGMIGIHLLSAALSTLIVIRGARRAVFYAKRPSEDLDFSAMEDTANA